jgi:two-component system, NtrC family, nitrogen regulation response regulator NtrX
MRIIIVDDDKNIRQTLSWLLLDEGHKVDTCTCGEEAIEKTVDQLYDVMFMDLKMPGISGLDALELVLKNQPQLKVFMISGQADLSTAVRATKIGAYDFFEKPLKAEKVLLEIKKLLEQEKALIHIEELEKLVDFDNRMIGESPSVQRLRDVISQASPSEGRILIYGENGTGKELVAREIYKNSNRQDGPFVQLNCAALPHDLLESELFGYEKGAFTGATRKKQGLIEQAEGGTLLLDEIGDMALTTQAKLLRVLQENEFYRVGGTSPHKFNVRIISATNKNLLAEIKKGAFREDLYFRLNVIPVTVPALRDRKSDIPLLVNHFLESYSKKNGKKNKIIDAHAQQLLYGYSWPGNIRELKNILERLAIMTKSEKIAVSDVELVLGHAETIIPRIISNNQGDILPFKDQIFEFEKKILQEAFERYNGNISQIAKALQTDRANLYKKLKKYGLKD